MPPERRLQLGLTAFAAVILVGFVGYQLIGDYSALIVRVAPDEIKAYPNACLHRGRQLRDGAGRRWNGRAGQRPRARRGSV